MKFTKSIRTPFLQNTSTLMAAAVNSVNQRKHTLKVYAAKKEMIYLNGTSKFSVSR